jgi:hypothetical protein
VNLLRILLLLLLSLCVLPVQAESAKTLLMPGKVIQGHAKYEDECEKCHKSFDKEAQDRMCADCHKDVGKDLADKTGFHGKMEEHKSCKECHAEHKGRNAQVVHLDEKQFDHKFTDYSLKGKHTKTECRQCHPRGEKHRKASHECSVCHKKDDDKVHKGKLGKKCETCHTEEDWKKISYDHDKLSKYPLRYKHKDAKCKDCHKNNVYKNTPKDCYSCHKPDDDKSHKGHNGKKCESCHTELDWKKPIFDHDKKTKFALKGKHKETKCKDCHTGDLYKDKLDMKCISCHRKTDDKAHRGRYGVKCETCHNELEWKKHLFDHDKSTKYPLKGKHKEAKCDKCHTGDLYKDKLKQDCMPCHKKEDDKTHKGRYGFKCETCHNELEWKKHLFDHDKKTKWPLKGKHQETKCDKCHTGDLYKDKLKQTCMPCHQKDDDKSHKGKLGDKCETCHTEVKWKELPGFNHSRTKFPLLGKHIPLECKKCHQDLLFKDTPRECFPCHKKDDEKSHKLRLGKKCETCHNARDWKTWDFNHDKRTKYKLEGAHKNVACVGCHTRPMEDKVVIKSSTCAACHEDNDVHNGGFGRYCERCHTVNKWKEIINISGLR